MIKNIAISIFALLTLILAFNGYFLKESNKLLASNLKQKEDNYLRKTGATTFCSEDKMLKYDFRSFDGGKIWYACEIGSDWELEILGKAEDIHPNLISCLDQRDDEINSLLSEKID